MSLPASITSALNWAWTEVQPAATFLYNSGVTAALAVNSAISGTGVQVVASIWASLGPVGAPLAITGGILAGAILGRHLWSDPSTTGLLKLVERIVGVAIILGAATATVALVGFAS